DVTELLFDGLLGVTHGIISDKDPDIEIVKKDEESIDVKQLRQILREEYKVVLAGGQGKLEEKIFRIGHLGWVNEDNIRTVISALKVALLQAGTAKVT
ncbi:MAG: hypothetical protein QF543_04700, partial [Dehalococcoidales bacterium]|nr:hypothetical protein [Dehalococcoidales bacterium]